MNGHFIPPNRRPGCGAAMASNSPATFQPSAERLSKSVYEAVGERYYKVNQCMPAILVVAAG